MATHHCMLAHKFDPDRIKHWPVVVEPKLDGVRVLAHVDRQRNTVVFRSRAHKIFTAFDHMATPLLAAAERMELPEVTFDGEMMSGSFAKTVSQARKKRELALDAVYHVFDLFSPAIVDDPRYFSRRAWLHLSELLLTPTHYAWSVEEIYQLYSQFRAEGFEGAIVKDPRSAYEFKRSYAWMKIKAEESLDLPVVGFTAGEGKHEGRLGALVVDHNGVNVKVGTGLSDELRDAIWRDTSNGYLGRIAEVAYHEITPDGSLRHPRFVRFRDITTHGVKE